MDTPKKQRFATLADAVKRWVDDTYFGELITANEIVIELPDKTCWLPLYPASNFGIGNRELALLALGHSPGFEPEAAEGLTYYHTIFVDVHTVDLSKAYCAVCGYIDLTRSGTN